jgi:NAD(P)-dependent dehydrogenase (short-subunit alcohol dehydrogenase family)
MRALVIGAAGTIGGAVTRQLEQAGWSVIAASRTVAPRIDLADPSTIEACFAALDGLDAVICCGPSTPLFPFVTRSATEFTEATSPKLFGQVALVRHAIDALGPGGSITLTGGALGRGFAPGAAAGRLVNRGLEAFVESVAPELPRELRLNLVSPGWVSETARSLGLDQVDSLPAATVAAAYLTAIFDPDLNGSVITPGLGP